MKKITFLLLGSAAFLAGCAQDDLMRTEGPTLTAGNALAANTALQMVDPWPAGVEDNEFSVPSDRGGESENGAGGTASSPKPVASTSASNP